MSTVSCDWSCFQPWGLTPRQGQGVALGRLTSSSNSPREQACLEGTHTSATAGGEFVYLLCLYPQPISGAGSGHKPMPFQHWSCQALGDEHMCRQRTVAVVWLISLAPTQPSLGIPSHYCFAPVGHCPSVALEFSTKYCSVFSNFLSVSLRTWGRKLGVIRNLQILLIWGSPN